MAIDTSGRWWVGSEAEDIRDYLVAYEAEGHPVDETRMCRCVCGGDAFLLEADQDEGCARRICADCERTHFICDSGSVWAEAEPEAWQCTECSERTCNLGVGFSLYSAGDNARDVRWLSVGNRCTRCGVLGSFVDWKVGYGPADQLMDLA